MQNPPANLNDRRVQRTRAALRDAFMTLLVERGWDGVNVQEVCARANVGRSTFYMHFADKDELVASGLDELRRAWRKQLAASGGGTPLAFSRGLIEHAHEHRRLFLALIGKRSWPIVQRRFRDLVWGLVREDLADRVAPARREAVVAFLAGALLEMLVWSLEARPLPLPAEVDRCFHALAAPVLATCAVPSAR